MVVQTNAPGLRESIIRQAQERGIELSIQEGSSPATKVQTGILRYMKKKRLETTLSGWESTEASKLAYWSVPQALRSISE